MKDLLQLKRLVFCVTSDEVTERPLSMSEFEDAVMSHQPNMGLDSDANIFSLWLLESVTIWITLSMTHQKLLYRDTIMSHCSSAPVV